MKTSKILTGKSLQEKLTYSQGDFLANLFPSQENNLEPKTSDSYREKCSELSKKSNPPSLWLKTFLDCLLFRAGWYSSKCSLTWKTKATKFNRSLYQLAPSMRRTVETGFGLLPTPTASDFSHKNIDENTFITSNGTYRHRNKGGKTSNKGLSVMMNMLPILLARDYIGKTNVNRNSLSIPDALGLLPTTTARDWKGARGGAKRGYGADINDKIGLLPTLMATEISKGCGPNQKSVAKEIQMLPTLKARDCGGSTYTENRHSMAVVDVIGLLPTIKATETRLGDQPSPSNVLRSNGMKLQPRFAEWMMGYPIGWTDVDGDDLLETGKKE